MDVVDGRRAATSRCRHSVSASTACLLMMYGACSGTTATPPIDDRFHTHAGVGGVDHPGQERPNAVEDAADVDVDDAVPVLDGRVPEISELLDACVVDQQPDRPEVAVGAFGQVLDGARVAHVADRVDGAAARRVRTRRAARSTD